MFSTEFIEGLPDNPTEAGHLLCEEFHHGTQAMKMDMDRAVARYSDLVVAYETVRVLIDVSDIQINSPDLGDTLEQNIETIFTVMAEVAPAFKNAEAMEQAHSVRNIMLANTAKVSSTSSQKVMFPESNS